MALRDPSGFAKASTIHHCPSASIYVLLRWLCVRSDLVAVVTFITLLSLVCIRVTASSSLPLNRPIVKQDCLKYAKNNESLLFVPEEVGAQIIQLAAAFSTSCASY